MPLDHLAVYLSNSCNLACSYCYVAVNQGPPARLSMEQIRRAVDAFYARVPAPDRKITFLGGEPLLDWKLFQDAARYAREAGGPDAILQTFTNGTTLTPEKVAFLDDWGVHCTISLDGGKSDNDRNRVYYKTPERSVYEDAMRRLGPLSKKNLGVSLVFTAATVDRLLSNVDLFHKMGFGRITFNPELYELWEPRRVDGLRCVMKGFARYYRLLLDRPNPFQIQILYSVLANVEQNKAGVRWWRDCHNMVLGPDANYYSCDKALSFPVGQAESGRAGSTETGLDWTRRDDQLAERAAAVERAGYGKDEYFCPIGVVEYARHAKKDPGELLENFHEVAAAFSEGLLELVALCKDHPEFERLYEHVRVV